MKLLCALFSSALALGCDGAGPPDAGTRDAGHDAGRDAGHDAGHDAGPGRDAGHDAGLDAGEDVAWTRVPGLPEGCVVDTTTDPAALEPFVIEPCPDRDGCTQLVPSWDTWFILMRVDGGVAVDGQGAFWFVRTAPVTYWERWLVMSDGTPMFGIRSLFGEGRCRHSAFDTDVSHLGFTIDVPVAGGDLRSHFVGGRWARGSASLELARSLEGIIPSGTFVQRMRAGDVRFALESAPRFSIVDVPWDGEPTMIAQSATSGGQTYVAASIGETVFYTVYGEHHHVRASSRGEPGRVFLDPTDAEAVRFVTDGVDMAWVQAYGRDRHYRFERIELWSAPYTTRPEDVRPRRITVLGGTNPYPEMAIGAGYVAAREWIPDEEVTVVRVFRLADGARATIYPYEGRSFRIAAAYILPDEIGVQVSRGGTPPQDIAFLRIRLDSLTFEPP
ncbi:MAG: hypothetical protein KF729_23895 [Sandaracinaceae bacterium]|nr:hypothetical protein [Sandaracinaceae bacterium]